MNVLRARAHAAQQRWPGSRGWRHSRARHRAGAQDDKPSRAPPLPLPGWPRPPADATRNRSLPVSGQRLRTTMSPALAGRLWVSLPSPAMSVTMISPGFAGLTSTGLDVCFLEVVRSRFASPWYGQDEGWRFFRLPGHRHGAVSKHSLNMSCHGADAPPPPGRRLCWTGAARQAARRTYPGPRKE